MTTEGSSGPNLFQLASTRSEAQKPNLASFFSEHQKSANTNERGPSLFSGLFGGPSAGSSSQVQRIAPPSAPVSMSLPTKPAIPPSNSIQMGNFAKQMITVDIPKPPDHATSSSESPNDPMQVDPPATPSHESQLNEFASMTLQRPSAPLPFAFSPTNLSRGNPPQIPPLVSPVPIRPLAEISSSRVVRQKRAPGSDLSNEAPAPKVRKLDDAPGLFTSLSTDEDTGLPLDVHRRIETALHVQEQSQGNLPPPTPTPTAFAPTSRPFQPSDPSPSPFKAPSQPFRPPSPAPRAKATTSNLTAASIQKSLSELPLQKQAMERELAHANRMSVDAEGDMEQFQFDELREDFLKHAETNSQMLAALKSEMLAAAERVSEISIEMLVHNNEMLALQASTVMELDASLKAANIRGEE